MDEPRETGGPRRGTSTGAARLGAAMARLAAKHVQPGDPDPCATCGLKEGTLPNMAGQTMIDAMRVLARIEGDSFGCHHGLNNGEPTRICARYLAAARGPRSELLEAIASVAVPPDDRPANDPVGVYVTAWAERIDPDRELNAYQLARAWERTGPHSIPGTEQ